MLKYESIKVCSEIWQKPSEWVRAELSVKQGAGLGSGRGFMLSPIRLQFPACTSPSVKSLKRIYVDQRDDMPLKKEGETLLFVCLCLFTCLPVCCLPVRTGVVCPPLPLHFTSCSPQVLNQSDLWPSAPGQLDPDFMRSWIQFNPDLVLDPL